MIGGSLSHKIGEDITFYITLNADNQIVGASNIKCLITGDNRDPEEKILSIESGEVFLTVPSIDQPGVMRVAITLLDGIGNEVSTIKPIQIGAFVNPDEITNAKDKPSDFESFWQDLIDTLYTVDPYDTSSPKSGQDANNYFHMEQITKADIPNYVEENKWQYDRNYKEEYLDVLDVYEFTLKCVGEMPATGFISIPKDASESKQYPIRIKTCGYGIYRAFMPWDTDAITVSMNTHGRPNMMSEKESEYLRSTNIAYGGLGSYGTQQGDYVNPENAYYTYVLLRNMQALRFAMDYADVKWNGIIMAKGASQGGFQSIAIAALATLTSDWETPLVLDSVDAVVPWFCDIGGDELGRSVCQILKYYNGIEYFDSANFATLIKGTKVALRGGYADPTVPPTGVMSIYNSLNCPKQLTFVQNHDHGSAPEENGIKDIISKDWN